MGSALAALSLLYLHSASSLLEFAKSCWRELNALGTAGEASRSSLGSDPGPARNSIGSGSAIPQPKSDALGLTNPSPAAERLASRITQAFSGRSKQ